MAPSRRPAPRSVDELRIRAEALVGRTLGEVAAALGFSLAGEAVRTKGSVGLLLELALGASAAAGAGPDFPELGVELKTVPVDERGAPRESTYVTSLPLRDADRLRWEDAVLRAKLAHVLFVAVGCEGPTESRRVEAAVFFRLGGAREAILRADFEHLVGLIGAHGPDALTAHEGRWLQVRPKAASSRVRTLAADGGGGLVEANPRGFYLRARFVEEILAEARREPRP